MGGNAEITFRPMHKKCGMKGFFYSQKQIFKKDEGHTNDRFEIFKRES